MRRKAATIKNRQPDIRENLPTENKYLQSCQHAACHAIAGEREEMSQFEESREILGLRL